MSLPYFVFITATALVEEVIREAKGLLLSQNIYESFVQVVFSYNMLSC